MRMPDWKTTSKRCGNTWPVGEGVWRPCDGPLLEWEQHDPETGILTMTCWHCRECGSDTFRAEPAPGSPAALACASGLPISSPTTGA